jgi:hypothetical protein
VVWITSPERLRQVWGNKGFTLDGKRATVAEIRQRINAMGRPRSTAWQRQVVVDLGNAGSTRWALKGIEVILGESSRYEGSWQKPQVVKQTTLLINQRGLFARKEYVVGRERRLVDRLQPDGPKIESVEQLVELWGRRPFTLDGKPATLPEIRAYLAQLGAPRDQAKEAPARIRAKDKKKRAKKNTRNRPKKAVTPLGLVNE